jgi:cell division protein FtsN
MSDTDRETYPPLPNEPTSDVDDQQEAYGRRGPFLLVVAMIVLVAFLGVVYVAYQQGIRQGQQMSPPLIVAEPGLVKVEPADPGGFEEPYQDTFVLNGEDTESLLETLLPPPEEPLERPASAEEMEATLVTDPPEAAEPESEILNIQSPPSLEELFEAVVEESATPDEPDAGAGYFELPPEPEGPAPTSEPGIDTVATGSTPPLPSQSASSGISAAAGSFVVQVAAVSSQARAQSKQNDVQDSHEAILIGLAFDIQEAVVPDRGTFYRVRIGPFDTRPQAVDLCETLKARGQDCYVTIP